MRLFRHPVKHLIIGLIRFYQVMLSPLHGPSCRFQPTCSQYFIQAVEKKGVFLGMLYGIWRVLRCNPLGGSGYDPV
ncbi:MAG: membrane protein insertion efficiency factor YidD [Planctomycetes bacterium]|nr:membrane protein insertion efficiency factor YidD [Planctomycetota bacterium]